jgi:hypothetical protein
MYCALNGSYVIIYVVVTSAIATIKSSRFNPTWNTKYVQTVATCSLISASRSLASTQTILYRSAVRQQRFVMVVIRRFGVSARSLVTCLQQSVYVDKPESIFTSYLSSCLLT